MNRGTKPTLSVESIREGSSSEVEVIERRQHAGFLHVVVAGLKSFPTRLFLFMVLFYLLLTGISIVFSHHLTFGVFNLVGWGQAFTTAWRQWDSYFFLQIARGGYTDQHLADFFPLYPVLIRLVVWPLGDHFTLAALIVSWLCSWGSYFWLYRLAEREYGEVVACWTLLFFAFCPLAFFTFAPYSEAVFLLVSIGSVERARAGHIWQASLLAALGMLARPTGILLIIPLGMEWGRRNPSVMRVVATLKQTLSRWRIPGARSARSTSQRPIWETPTQPMNPRGLSDFPSWDNPTLKLTTAEKSLPLSAVFSLTLIPLALLGYMLYLQEVTGNPLAFLKAESLWNRHLTPPWQTLRLFLTAFQIARQRGTSTLYFTNILDLVLILGLPTIVLYFTLRHRRLWPGAALYQLAISILVFIEPTYPLPNVAYKIFLAAPRYMLPAFPIFLLLGQLGATRPRLARILLVGSFLLLAFLTLRSLGGSFIS